jgi:uroporphyrinogen decarboxylase
LTHRERIAAALDHREPDRVPLDVGTARFSGMIKGAYERLVEHLGFGEPGAIIDRMQQVVEVDERVLAHLGADARALAQGAPDRGGDVELNATDYRDEWGVVRTKPEGCLYYDIRQSPLAGEISAGDILRYPWPDPTDPGRFRGLGERAQRLHEETDYAVIFNARYNVVHTTQYLRGFEDWYYDLGQNHELFQALMEAVLENLLELNRRALAEVGPYVDVVAFGDDVGLQDRPVCSPPLYRKLIRPCLERVVEQIRQLTSAKILYHSCGSVYRLIPDFIEIGIDALNPVQVTAKNMEPERLKREFGDRIAFWGGVDNNRLLPQGTPDEVRRGTRRMFEILGPGGGYVMAAVHNIQPDVPPENICALFDEGRRCLYGPAGQRAAGQ